MLEKNNEVIGVFDQTFWNECVSLLETIVWEFHDDYPEDLFDESVYRRFVLNILEFVANEPFRKDCYLNDEQKRE